MLVVDRAVKAPACCIICMHSDGPFIDTFRDYDPGRPTAISGRKYVCEACVTRFAEEFGLFDAAREPVEAELALAYEELESVRAEADVVAASKELQRALEARLPKRRTRKKKAAKK